MPYDYRSEQFPPSLDFRALSDIVTDAKQGNISATLKPFYHVEGWLFGIFGGDNTKPDPAPPAVHAENPMDGGRTYSEGYVHAAQPFTEAELAALSQADEHGQVMALPELILAYRVLRTLALYAPELYAVVKTVLGKLTHTS